MVEVFARVDTMIKMTEEEFEKVVQFSKSRFTTSECENEVCEILERRLPGKAGYIPSCSIVDTIYDLGWEIDDENDYFNDVDF